MTGMYRIQMTHTHTEQPNALRDVILEAYESSGMRLDQADVAVSDGFVVYADEMQDVLNCITQKWVDTHDEAFSITFTMMPLRKLLYDVDSDDTDMLFIGHKSSVQRRMEQMMAALAGIQVIPLDDTDAEALHNIIASAVGEDDSVH